MTVKELIEELQKIEDQNEEVYRWNDDNYLGFVTEVFRVEWMDKDVHPVVDGVITHQTIKVLVVN